MALDTFRSWMEIGASAVTILGLPLALVSYNIRKRNELREQTLARQAAQEMHDDQTYAVLHDKYNEYLTLVLQYPELDLADQPLSRPVTLSPEQEAQAVALFNIFLSLIESAFLRYSNASDVLKSKQWDGWREYAAEMLSRSHINRLYQMEKVQYDTSFIADMDHFLAIRHNHGR